MLAEGIEMLAEDIEMPAEGIEMPAEGIEMSAEGIEMPAEGIEMMIKLPRIHPAQAAQPCVHAPGGTVRVVRVRAIFGVAMHKVAPVVDRAEAMSTSSSGQSAVPAFVRAPLREACGQRSTSYEIVAQRPDRGYMARMSCRTWTPALLGFASLACASLRAPLTCPARGGAPWVEMTSEHFVLRTDAA